jgi:hypothetical protein
MRSSISHATHRATPEHSSGIFHTSPGLLRRRLLGPSGPDLAEYLALRLGDTARANAAYKALVRMVGVLPPGELLEAPGPTPRLFRLARSLAFERLRHERPDDKREPLPFVRVAGARGEALRKVRAELEARDAELLELRHARGLSVVDIAFVLEEPLDAVELALDTAEARGRQLLERHAPDPIDERASVYADAFALEPGWRAEDEDEAAAEDESPLEPGTIIGGRYRVVERVGVGAFGDVYRADDTEVPGHRVALKLLRQPSRTARARQTALRELRLNAAVFHPSLVQFKDHGWYDERLWFVMPWYEGETLEQRIRRGALSRAEARRIFEPLARALAALHAAGIRHQDIKPDNVLLTKLPGDDELLPVLIDLGVAAEEEEGLLGGTPLYFAPEVASRFLRGDRARGAEVGPAADVFALVLSLRNALEPGTQDEVPSGGLGAFIARRAHETPSFPEARSLRYLRPWLSRALSADPAERPTADELATELAILTEPEERRARRVRVARWLGPLLFALAALFAVVVAHFEQQAGLRAAEAESARTEAAEAQAGLLSAEAQQRALEQGHAELLARYEQSRLSRSELASQLATAEGRLQTLGTELGATRHARDAAREQLTATRATLTQRETELTTTRQERDGARQEASGLGRDLEASRAELRRREAEVTEARTRAQSLAAQLATERTGREEAEGRARDLGVQLAEAQRAQRAAEGELSRVRAHLARLAAIVRAAEASAEQTPDGAAENTPGDDG